MAQRGQQGARHVEHLLLRQAAGHLDVPAPEQVRERALQHAFAPPVLAAKRQKKLVALRELIECGRIVVSHQRQLPILKRGGIQLGSRIP